MTNGTDTTATAGAPSPDAGKPGFGKSVLLALTLIVTLVLASGWLIMPYFFEGKSILTDISDQVAAAHQPAVLAGSGDDPRP